MSLAIETPYRPKPPPRKPRDPILNASKPLRTPTKEHFAQLIANMVPAPEAYKRAGYKGSRDARSQLRRSPDVDARITWLVNERIRSDTEARHRREKPIHDLRERLIKQLERQAFGDVRSVQQWRRVPIVDAEGSVTGYRDELITTPSERLAPDAAAKVKALKTKAGQVQVEFHDPQVALDKLCRIAGLYADATPSVTVNQVNVSAGSDTALEAARRLAFAISAAEQAARLAAPEPKTIEHEAAPSGYTAEAKPKP